MSARPDRALPRLLFLLLLLALPRAAQGQVRPDSARTDTVQVAIPPESVSRDTLPRDSLRESARDSAVVVTLFPRYPRS